MNYLGFPQWLSHHTDMRNQPELLRQDVVEGTGGQGGSHEEAHSLIVVAEVHIDLGTSTKKVTPFHGGQGSALLLIDQGGVLHV